jgi:hypothetical protein
MVPLAAQVEAGLRDVLCVEAGVVADSERAATVWVEVADFVAHVVTVLEVERRYWCGICGVDVESIEAGDAFDTGCVRDGLNDRLVVWKNR